MFWILFTAISLIPQICICTTHPQTPTWIIPYKWCNRTKNKNLYQKSVLLVNEQSTVEVNLLDKVGLMHNIQLQHACSKLNPVSITWSLSPEWSFIVYQFDDILVCTPLGCACARVCSRACKMKSVLSHITADYITGITFKYFQT
jgi:hypothetical protein